MPSYFLEVKGTSSIYCLDELSSFTKFWPKNRCFMKEEEKERGEGEGGRGKEKKERGEREGEGEKEGQERKGGDSASSSFQYCVRETK